MDVCSNAATYDTALEILEKYANLREGEHDYSRALAFRRASCVLKSLPFTLTSTNQLQNLPFVGGHSRLVIQEILEEEECVEVENCRRDPWFHKMKLFSGVFGVGPSTAKKWIEKGWTSIVEAQQGHTSADWRQRWGLGFHDDLATPVQRPEADHILDVVQTQLDRLLPGAVMVICGGFRRGKAVGHDVDILITHPTEGREVGVLPKLVQALTDTGVVLCGKLERNTFSSEVLYTDSKLSARGQLDHFEKWLGIFKVPKKVGTNPNSNTHDARFTVLYTRTRPEENLKGTNESSCNQVNISTTDFDKLAEGSKTDTDVADAQCAVDDKKPSPTGDQPNASVSGSVDDFEPKAKRQRTCEDTDISPLEMSRKPRDWIARRVDLIVCPYSQYFYALVGWTGNKMFNRDLRWYSERKLGHKLTSHGLYSHVESKSVPANSEKEVFEHLQVPYREPWERNC